MATNVKATYSDTSTNIRNVVPIFDLLSPKELPLLKLISGGSEDRPSLASLSESCRATKYEWIEDQDPAWTITFDATTNFTGTTTDEITGIGVSTGHGARVRVGQIIEVLDANNDRQQSYVTAVSGDTIAIKRGWAGTTTGGGAYAAPAAIASVASATIVGRVHLEGAAAPDDVMYYPTLPYNYVQEFAEAVTLTNQEQRIARYGIDAALDYETDKVVRKMLKNIERQVIFGKRVLGTSAVPAAFGGLPEFINTTVANFTNIHATGASLTKALINTRLEATFAQVGAANMPDTLLCSATGKRYLGTIYGATGVTTYRDQNNPIGGDVIEMVKTDVCDLQIVLVNDMPDTQMYMVKKDKLGIGPLNGMAMKREMMAKTGTADTWMVYGAYTFEARQSLSHCGLGKITGASTS